MPTSARASGTPAFRLTILVNQSSHHSQFVTLRSSEAIPSCLVFRKEKVVAKLKGENILRKGSMCEIRDAEWRAILKTPVSRPCRIKNSNRWA